MQKVGFFQSIHFKIALVYVLLLLVAMQVIGVSFIGTLQNKFEANFKSQLTNTAQVLANSAGNQIQEAALGNSDQLETDLSMILNNYSNDFPEVQVISTNQVLLATSKFANQENVGKRTTNTLVQLALVTLSEQSKKFRNASSDRILAIAYPITQPGGNVLGVVYIKASMKQVYDQLDLVIQTFEKGIVISLALTALLGIFLSRTITRPVSDMRKHALQIAHGDFSRKVRVYGNDEIGQLATSFNQMITRLKNANETTEAERKKLKSVLSYMTDGVIATDRNGNVILMNDRAEELLNVYRQNVFGMPVLSLLKLGDTLKWDELDTVSSTLLDFSDEEKKHILRANFSFIQKDNGPFNGLIVVLHDVTEQEQIEGERREFVSNVSHELRTPLTTMKSYLEALSDGALYDETLGPKFLTTAQNETERMIRLVKDLLLLSRMDSQEGQLEWVRVDFTEFFHQIIDRFEMTKNENIHFNRQLPNHKVYTHIDRDKMTQVLDNLISNALKYSPDGGTVTFRLKVLNHHIHATITDEGVGIPKSKVSKVFDRFYRVDKARSRKLGGTGLGLAIAREIVHAHSGEVWAESEWKKGSILHLTLPVAEGERGRYR